MRRLLAAMVVACLAGALVLWAPWRGHLPRLARPGCDLYAASWGRAGSDGTFAAPFRTATELASALRPGQTGCLEPGVFRESPTLAHGGRPGAPVVIESASHRYRATILGRVYVTRTAHDLVLRDLVLNGRNGESLPSPTVNGVRIAFVADDVTNDHTAICFDLGSSRYGIARQVAIEGSRIHDCGRLPATNFDHGIYVAVATGTRIVGNYIYDNADRGVQLYPAARDTLVAHNVIESNGEGVIFGGNSTQVSSGNRVVENVIANSRVRADVETSWSGPVGRDNEVVGNCLWGGAHGVFELDGRGRPRLAGNRIADPGFVNASGHDFRLRAGSPCAGLGPARQPPM